MCALSVLPQDGHWKVKTVGLFLSVLNSLLEYESGGLERRSEGCTSSPLAMSWRLLSPMFSEFTITESVDGVSPIFSASCFCVILFARRIKRTFLLMVISR